MQTNPMLSFPPLKNQYFSAAGGVRYHIKALRFQKTLWSPFIQALEGWLEHLPIKEKRLHILGPSAGYSLPKNFIEKFSEITANEPDPLARWLFQKKIKNIQWEDQNYFAGPKGLDPKLLKTVRQRNPQAVILFSNLIGQLPLMYKNWSEQKENWIGEFRKLKGTLISYHDLFSFESKEDLSFLPSSNENLFETLQQKVNLLGSSEFKVLDHETSDLVGEAHTRDFLWRIEPQKYHIVRGIFRANQPQIIDEISKT